MSLTDLKKKEERKDQTYGKETRQAPEGILFIQNSRELGSDFHTSNRPAHGLPKPNGVSFKLSGLSGSPELGTGSLGSTAQHSIWTKTTSKFWRGRSTHRFNRRAWSCTDMLKVGKEPLLILPGFHYWSTFVSLL